MFTKLVERNTTIPTEKKETFTTAEDNQTAVTIVVYQGERPMAADNRYLAKFDLQGIPPARMGTPQIEVTFNLDANGILNVSAKDKGTGVEKNVKVEAGGGLSKEEIERMQRDAEAHAADDKKKRDLAEARNTAEQRVYQLEKTLDEHKRQALRRRQAGRPGGHRGGERGQEGRRPGRAQHRRRQPESGQPGDGRAHLRRQRGWWPRRRRERRNPRPATARERARRPVAARRPTT